MEDKITAILKDEFLSANFADKDLNANLGNVVKIEEKDYNRINNKPQINGVILQGDKSALELGLVPSDLSQLEAVKQPTKSVRQTADMFVDNGGKPSKIALQQVKDMATKIVYADELENIDFEKLDVDDYVILGDKIYRVIDTENNIEQLLPETSAEHVTFADKTGEYTSTNVEDALAEVIDIAQNGGVTGVKGNAETEYRKGDVNITKENIGLGNVDNTADLDKPISTAQETVNAEFEHNFKQLNSDIDTLGKGLNERIDTTNSNLAALRESTESALSNQQESISDIDSTLNSHIANQNNPHNVTKAQVGLDKVDNTADLDKIVKEAGKVTQKLRFMGALESGGFTSVPYDGSKDTSVTLNGNDFLMGGESLVGSQSVSYELKKTGVTAGAYNGITVDEKGRVTAAEDKGYATKQELQEAVAGKVKTFTYDNYQAFVSATDSLAKTAMGVGDNVYIKTLEVPDMWVTRVNAVSTLYTYTSDQAIVDALNSQYGLTVGYFTFSQLETTKVDLTNYQQKTDDGLLTNDKTIVGGINEVKSTADNSLSKANTNATEISSIKDGTTKVGNAQHADTADTATNVTTNINGKSISSIFETDGTTIKEATHATKATSADKATQSDNARKVGNSFIVSGQNAQGTESTIGFDGSQAQEVAFNENDFVATKGNAFEVSLAPSGATIGTYNNVTVDEKGRVITGKNEDYATTAQVNAKQNALTEEQLAAVNSGITSSKVTQYDGYKATIDGKANTSDLSRVATSGSYNDLSNKPTIPTNYVTTNTAQSISAIKTFTVNQRFSKSDMDISKASSTNKYSYIAFDDANTLRAGVLGGMQTTDNYCGTYLQARNGQQIRVLSNADGSITKTHAPSPSTTDDSTQIATTNWVRTNYQEKGYAGVDGAVLNSDGEVTDKDGNVVDALYFKVASLTTSKVYMRTYLLAEVAMTNNVVSQATVLIRCNTEANTSAPNVRITFDSRQYDKQLLAKNIFVTADYKSGTNGATFTVWVRQDANYMQQVWNVLAQTARGYEGNAKRPWTILYSNLTKATAVTDISTAPTGYTRIVANNNSRYSNLEENTYLWQQSQNAGITWKRYSDYATRAVLRHYDDGTTENLLTQSNGFVFRPLNNVNSKAIKVDPANGALYPEQNGGATLGKESQKWSDGYINEIHANNIAFDGNGLSTGTLGSTKLSQTGRLYVEKEVDLNGLTRHIACVFYVDNLDAYYSHNAFVPIRVSNGIQFVGVYVQDDGAPIAPRYTVKFGLYNASGTSQTNTAVTSGTFKYKFLD